MNRDRQVINSALWAAYGDALGFITEFATEGILRSKLGRQEVECTVPWVRRIGGRSGVSIELPAGCYSDDTQLRLATSRSIRASGEFDPEVFSKIELPVWLSYQLGGGKGTKAAASWLVRRTATWSTNFFGKGGDYVRGGGNGAAMRIQPHVWSASDITGAEGYVADVVRNSLITHGHARGILGAVLHSISLAEVLRSGTVPAPDDWMSLISEMRSAEQFIRTDDYLRTFWLPSWERLSNQNLRTGFEQVIAECHADAAVLSVAVQASQFDYCRVASQIGGLSASSRGSGTKTALLALVLAWRHQADPSVAVNTAANCLGSDTDTVATLTGALVGAAADEAPNESLLDSDYIRCEAERLNTIRNGRRAPDFRHPSVVRWVPPTNQSDAVGDAQGRMALAGLGYVAEPGERFPDPSRPDFAWQWLKLDYGQTVLARLRLPLRPLPSNSLPAEVPTTAHRSARKSASTDASTPLRQAELFAPATPMSDPRARTENAAPVTLDELTRDAIDSGFDPALIGRTLLALCEEPSGLEKAIGYAAIIAKAKRARSALRTQRIGEPIRTA